MSQRLTFGRSNTREVGVEVAKLLGAFTSTANADEAKAEAYLDAVEGIPAWAVREARKRVLAGEDGRDDRRFAPTPPQFAVVAATITGPIRKAVREIEALLAAPDLERQTDPTERARVTEGFDKLRGGLSGGPAKARDAVLSRSALEQRAASIGASASLLDDLPDQPGGAE